MTNKTDWDALGRALADAFETTARAFADFAASIKESARNKPED